MALILKLASMEVKWKNLILVTVVVVSIMTVSCKKDDKVTPAKVDSAKTSFTKDSLVGTFTMMTTQDTVSMKSVLVTGVSSDYSFDDLKVTTDTLWDDSRSGAYHYKYSCTLKSNLDITVNNSPYTDAGWTFVKYHNGEIIYLCYYTGNP